MPAQEGTMNVEMNLDLDSSLGEEDRDYKDTYATQWYWPPAVG